MGDPPGKSGMRFLSFANDKEDAEKDAKLREIASKLEDAVTKRKANDELIDYVPSTEDAIDLANDSRTLYERLQEQKTKKQEQVEEAQKLSNWVPSYDDDDIEYLNELERKKKEAELTKRLQEYDAMEQRKIQNEKKMELEEERVKESLAKKAKFQSKNTSIKNKLSTLIKVKPKSVISFKGMGNQESEEKRPKIQDEHLNEPSQKTISKSETDAQTQEKPEAAKTDSIPNPGMTTSDLVNPSQVMKCIGVLPSLPIVKRFHTSSDESNSDDDLEARIVPRIRVRKR